MSLITDKKFKKFAILSIFATITNKNIVNRCQS